MILEAEKLAKKKGFDCVYLVCSENVGDFYKKCGYSEIKSCAYMRWFKKKIWNGIKT